MTQPSREQAREMLADIDQVAKRMRNTTAAGALGPNLVIWGLVWMAGFVGTMFAQEKSGMLWGGVLAIGGLATVIVGVRESRKRLILSEAEKKLGLQMFLFWITVFAFATALLFTIRPRDGRDICVIFVLFSMMAYVIMGIWVRSGVLAVTGLVVAAATVVGRLLLGEQQFLIWMAVFGGGGLLVPGLYIQWRWR